MSNEPQVQPQQETPQVTADTPVSQEELQRLDLLGRARNDAANELADLELAKVNVLRAIRDLDTERTRLYNQILATRGIDPNTKIQIDGRTGAIRVLKDED